MSREPRDDREVKTERHTTRLDDETNEAFRAELDRLSISGSEFTRQALRFVLGLASIFDARPTMADNVGDAGSGRRETDEER